ncbi:unnamed protein product (mitochondrion) [Plasmodiophora brassicae]|uniref:DUF1279 domain-containing protein n=1 Tax=Plasmodiophora brassicae TaxID=37360 RepID=A0A3P3Y233_PLABS|nr:unnamed protein product [Plasmodiophora brassicae]
MMMFRVAAGARHLVARPMCTVGRRPAAAPLEQTPLEQATAAAQKAPGKLRDLWNKYGVVAVSTYAVTYVSTLGLIYALLESPFLSPGDSLRLLDSIGAGRIFDLSQINPKAGSFAVAWILAKFTEPLRLGFTVLVTPRIALWIRRGK